MAIAQVTRAIGNSNPSPPTTLALPPASKGITMEIRAASRMPQGNKRKPDPIHTLARSQGSDGGFEGNGEQRFEGQVRGSRSHRDSRLFQKLGNIKAIGDPGAGDRSPDRCDAADLRPEIDCRCIMSQRFSLKISYALISAFPSVETSITDDRLNPFDGRRNITRIHKHHLTATVSPIF